MIPEDFLVALGMAYMFSSPDFRQVMLDMVRAGHRAGRFEEILGPVCEATMQ